MENFIFFCWEVKDLITVEEGMVELIHELKICKAKINFQRKLNEDLKIIKSSNKTLTKGDKTSNRYKFSKK